MRLILLALTVSVLLTAQAEAQTTRWMATSRTSMAITGNITLKGDRIIFGNGKAIRLKPAGLDRPGVYTLARGGNPRLAHGNYLCGPNMPPTYITLVTNGNALYMQVFNSRQPPAAPNPAHGYMPQRGTCATYNYER